MWVVVGCLGGFTEELMFEENFQRISRIAPGREGMGDGGDVELVARGISMCRHVKVQGSMG